MENSIPLNNAAVSFDFGRLATGGKKFKQIQGDIYAIASDNKRRAARKWTPEQVVRAIERGDIPQIREISEFIYNTNGIYQRAVRYLADIYRFDYIIYPNLKLGMEITEKVQKAITKRFYDASAYFDASHIAAFCRRACEKVLLQGAYYGYIVEDVADELVVQDLPVNYCRSVYFFKGLPFVEFNIRYFDDITGDPARRDQILKLFPIEFQKAYASWAKERTIAKEKWIPLDLDRVFRFSFSDNEMPPLAHAILTILELQDTQELIQDRLLQDVTKMISQKFPLDQNGELQFAQPHLDRLHNSLAAAIADTPGVTGISTIGDLKVLDLTSTSSGDAGKSIKDAENTVYNDLGVSRNLFNTDGNLALDKSVLDDAAFMKGLVFQLERFFQRILSWKFPAKKDQSLSFKILETTLFNQQDLQKTYQDLVKLGFSRFWPVAVLGHTMTEIIGIAQFENTVLNLDMLMIPPLSSNTLNPEAWIALQTGNLDLLKTASGSTLTTPSTTKPTESTDTTNPEGRPEKPDDEKSEKTIANAE